MKIRPKVITILLWLWVIVAMVAYLDQYKGLAGAILKQLSIDLF